MIALGFLAAISVIRKLAIHSKLDFEKVVDLSFWILLTGFAGARLLFIITRLSDYAADPLGVFKIWEGGFVFFGSLITAFPFCLWYMKKYRLPTWKTFDVLLPGLAIAHAFGRIGCLAAGCCYGKPTGTSFGIKLNSELVDLSYRNIPLHPTQLYESGALMLLFLGLLWVYYHRKFEGQVALTYFISYPIIRSIIEVFRGDLIRGFVIDGVLSTSQFISILVFLIASCILVVRLRGLNSQRKKK